MILWWGNRKKQQEAIDKLSARVEELERKCQNMEAEMFLELSRAQMPDKTVKERITLRGMVSILCKKVLGNESKESKAALIHRPPAMRVIK